MDIKTEHRGYTELLAALEKGDAQLILRAYRELRDQKEALATEVVNSKIERDRYRECLRQVSALLVLEPATAAGSPDYTNPYYLKRLIEGVLKAEC